MSSYPGQINDQYIKEYIEKIVPEEENDFIYALEKKAIEEGVPIIDCAVKKMLEVIIKMQKVQSILEVGTAIGYSGIVFSKAMNYKGYIKSFEINEEMIGRARQNIRVFEDKYNQKLNIDLILADAKHSLEKEDGLYDMIFIDAAKGHYRTFFDQIYDNLKDGSVIISDNVLFKGMIATDKYVQKRKITIVKRMRNYIDFIMNHPKLETTVIPIGDGVAISYYNGGKDE